MSGQFRIPAYAFAPAPVTAKKPKKISLREQVSNLKSENDKLKTENQEIKTRLDAVETDVEEKLQVKQVPPPPPQKYNFEIGTEGLWFRYAKQHQLRLGSIIQVDERAFVGDSVASPRSQFNLRRARLIVEGQISRYFQFRFMPDFGRGKPGIVDAYGNIVAHPAFQIQFGKFREPVGLERQQNTAHRKFEVGFTSQFSPNRDIGVMIHGNIREGLLLYQLGIFNGVVDGTSSDGDTDSDKDIAGRIFTRPFLATRFKAWHGLGFGAAFTLGKSHGDSNNTGLSTLTSAGDQPIGSFISNAFTEEKTVAKGQQWRLSLQGYYYFKGLGLLGEYTQSTHAVSFEDKRARFTDQAAQGQISYLFNGLSSYQAPKIVGIDKGGIGGFELAARYQWFKADSDSFPNFRSSQTSVSRVDAWEVSFRYYFNPNVLVLVDYGQNHFHRGADEGNRPIEQSLFFRQQLSF